MARVQSFHIVGSAVRNRYKCFFKKVIESEILWLCSNVSRFLVVSFVCLSEVWNNLALAKIMLVLMYRASYEPLSIFGNDAATRTIGVSCVLPTMRWISSVSVLSWQHAWYSCRAGCFIVQENSQELATHSTTSMKTNASSVILRTLTQ